MADISLGHVAYEAYVRLIAKNPTLPWDELRPPVRVRWETVATDVLEACGGSGCQSPHGPDGRCFDCATDDEMAAAIPPPPGGSNA